MDASAYPVIVRPLAPEQGVGYVAEVPDLPGCTAGGPTLAEATTAAREWAGESDRRAVIIAGSVVLAGEAIGLAEDEGWKS